MLITRALAVLVESGLISYQSESFSKAGSALSVNINNNKSLTFVNVAWLVG